MSMNASPYLSIVVTSRNDNHGGYLLRQMQSFIDHILIQCDRLQLPAELIIVEWNPPAAQPSLTAVLSWQKATSFCPVRVITVPTEIHQSLQASDLLFMFQMMAKNVGIRRSRGEFILVTGVDQIFSSEFFEWVASRSLQSHVLYRCDRYDIPPGLPSELSLEEQLNYCQQHIQRIHTVLEIQEITPPAPPEPETAAASEPVGVTTPEPEPPAKQAVDSLLPTLKSTRKLIRNLLPTSAKDFLLDLMPVSWKRGLVDRGLLNAKPEPPPPPPPPPPPTPDPFAEFLTAKGYPLLYTRNCSEFILMDRADWFALKGFPELQLFSSHLAALLCHSAHTAGIRQEILAAPIRAYHLEHGAGWVAEGDRELLLNARLGGLGIPFMSAAQFDALAQLMQKTGNPLVFNNETWGFAEQQFAEQELPNN